VQLSLIGTAVLIWNFPPANAGSASPSA